ncbi:MAG: CoB--CoM heterodisulfide reductase iron-sulfur subunit B family protein [Candidatus Bathyarchaeota archaeon]|nr:CoB--CoM heterodisulfide reductase iron-sulfur subunit B family protein [Candidatus Bathyarchaeota archaeon]UCD26239.1 MAG: CoB--CoM heterodisulfide reductase iron-sulfur subunit B family protein [Candidatus Bathyarchaeota archaeon]UCE57753.1 MAG: CoB--CoM heterodisulfide reductase iron-sulfur subunit B family protein [Candidatus Bathyarchaeota archaeon]
MKYLLFLGCVIPYRISSYEISARKVLEKLSIELVEMPEFNCCGLPLDPVNHELMLTLATRNLCLAEQKGLDIMTLCPGCAGTLRKVNKALREDKKLKELVNGFMQEIDLEFRGGIVKVKHLVQVLAEDVGFKRMREAIQNPLTGLKVAEHNGCHVLRPAKYVGFDDPENPVILKKLIELTGALCLDYMYETECCGAPIIGVNDKIPLHLTGEKLRNVKAVGAQALITVCPFCHMMFDLNQPRIERVLSEKFGVPVLHYTQLLGLAMGFSPDELGLEQLRVKASKILNLN